MFPIKKDQRKVIKVINKIDLKSEGYILNIEKEFSGEIINLDDFFIDLPKLNLIKIDVDGFDFKVLQGAKEIIKLCMVWFCRPEIDLNRNGDSVSDIIDLFTDIGYSGILENGKPIVSAEQLLIGLKEVTHTNGIFTYDE